MKEQKMEQKQNLANSEEQADGIMYQDDTMIHDTKPGSEEPAAQRSANVTFEEAAQVIEELESEQAEVNPRTMRARLGRGSYTHLRDLYKLYNEKKLKEAEAFTALNVDAKDMEMRAKELVSLAVQSNYRIVNEEREFNRTQLKNCQARYDALVQGYKKEIEQLKADKTDLSEALKKARNEAESMALKLANKTTEHINLQKENAALKATKTEQAERIAELKSQIETLTKAVNQLSKKQEKEEGMKKEDKPKA